MTIYQCVHAKMLTDDTKLFNEDLTGTIFENIEDLPIMSFINEILIDKELMETYNLNCESTIFNTLQQNNKNKLKQEYYQFVIRRLNELINIRPGSDTELLFKIAIMEWNHMCSLKNVKNAQI
jgi:hypothetical protein